MTEFNRQQLVRLLDLPYDVTNMINSFLFYDSKTGKIRRRQKNIMFQICLKFENALTSRKYPRGNYHADNSDECEHWAVCLSDHRFVYANIEVQIQGMNCEKCGNYYNIDGPFNIQCNC
jgi:hypothetical protein